MDDKLVDLRVHRMRKELAQRFEALAEQDVPEEYDTRRSFRRGAWLGGVIGAIWGAALYQAIQLLTQ